MLLLYPGSVGFAVVAGESCAAKQVATTLIRKEPIFAEGNIIGLKVIIIIGAPSGIEKELALQLARQDAKLCLAARD
jgi:hypothetical protein